MKLDKNSLLETIERYRNARFVLARAGGDLASLRIADYLAAYEELAASYPTTDIITCILGLFGSEGLVVSEMTIAKKVEALGLLSSLFEVKEEHYSVPSSVEGLILTAVSGSEDHCARNLVEIFKIGAEDDYAVERFSVNLALEARSALQEVDVVTRAYVEAVEGTYKNSLIVLAFFTDILRKKRRSMKKLLLLGHADLLSIVRSYDGSLAATVAAPYDPVIRNAASHGGVDARRYPDVRFTDRDKSGRVRETRENFENLEDRTFSVFSVAAAVWTGFKLAALYPAFDRVYRRFCRLTGMSLRPTEDMRRRESAYKRRNPLWRPGQT